MSHQHLIPDARGRLAYTPSLGQQSSRASKYPALQAQLQRQSQNLPCNSQFLHQEYSRYAVTRDKAANPRHAQLAQAVRWLLFGMISEIQQCSLLTYSHHIIEANIRAWWVVQRERKSCLI